MSHPSARRPSHWRRAIFGWGVALAVLLGMEGVLRLTLGPPPAPVAVFAALGPHDQYIGIDGTQAMLRYGKRRPPAFSLTAAGPRVVVLGGSSVHEGTPRLPLAREFPGRLATALGVEVLNLGSPGLDSHDLVRITEELAAVDVDTVVVYTGHNDFGNTYFAQRYGTVESAARARLLGVLSQLQLYAQLSRLVLRPTGVDRSTGGAGPPGRAAPTGLTAEQRALTVAALARNLERIAWMTARRDQALILVPPVSRLTTRPWEGACEPGTCPSEQLEVARSMAATDPAGAVALLQALRDADPMTLRAHTAAQHAVARVAGNHGHVTLVDAFALLPRDPVFDIPHRRLFIDPVHFAEEGHIAMAELLVGPISDSLVH